VYFVDEISSSSGHKYRVIRNDCWGFNNLSYTIHLRYEDMWFLFNRKTLQVFVTYFTGALYVNLCDSTNINTIIEFVPCLWHASGDGFSGGSDSYLQFRDTCGKRRNINLILDVTP